MEGRAPLVIGGTGGIPLHHGPARSKPGRPVVGCGRAWSELATRARGTGWGHWDWEGEGSEEARGRACGS